MLLAKLFGYFAVVQAGFTVAASLGDRHDSCNHDNCLRAFIKKGASASAFCSSLTTSPPHISAPAFVSACSKNQASQITSACACLNTATTTSSASFSSSSSSFSSSASSTSTSTTITVSTTPSCEPSFVLNGVSETDFNLKGSPFSLGLSCGQLDVNKFQVLLNYVNYTALTATTAGISFTGIQVDYALLSVFALDTSGTPIVNSFQLLFGNINMPVKVLGPDGNPMSNALVIANASIYPGVGHACTTDATGSCTFQNLISTTIGLVAKTDTNSIAVDGLAATSGQVTLNLLPYVDPKAGASFDIANGTTGWDGVGVPGTINSKRDTTLVVSTGGQYTLQSANNSFPVHPFTKKAYIKYKFVTSEVPGGYFGSQFNDYYSITIRSNTGAFVTVTNSMNALGLGAFDASGATNWFTLTLPVPSNTKSVRYDVGISNVADNLLDSEVIVDKVGDLQCDKCGDCTSCPTDPMCQPSCSNPPVRTCDFYRNCAEGQLGCGPGQYPLNYGEKNCLKISKNAPLFSAAGQAWIWGTMHCLQTSMVPVLQPCTATCDSFSAAAFASHTPCYLQNGICSLPCTDLVLLFASVASDLFTKESLKQAWGVGGGCMQNIVQTLQGCGGTVAEIIIILLLKAKI